MLLHQYLLSVWRVSLYPLYGYIFSFIPVYLPFLTRTNICTMDRRSTECQILPANVQLSIHLITHAILSLYITTLAFTVQQSHMDARYIAKFNAFRSHSGRFRLRKVRTNTFSYAITSATVYDPYLNSLVAWIFSRFCSSANCERVFQHIGRHVIRKEPPCNKNKILTNCAKVEILILFRIQCTNSSLALCVIFTFFPQLMLIKAKQLYSQSVMLKLSIFYHNNLLAFVIQ